MEFTPKIIRKFVVFLCLYSGVLVATGQMQEKPPLPDGPLVKSPAGFSTWQTVYLYGSEKKAPEPNVPPHPTEEGALPTRLPRRVVTVRTQAVSHSMVEDIEGNKIELWAQGSTRMFKSQGFPVPREVPQSSRGSLLPDYAKLGFPDVGWVSPQTCAGVEKQYLVFKKDGMTLYVDMQTRYPVMWVNADERRVFTELPPPNEMLVMPPDFAAVIQQKQHDHDLLMRPLAP